MAREVEDEQIEDWVLLYYVWVGFGIAFDALTALLDDAQRADAVKSWRAFEYEFGWTPPPPPEPDPPPYVTPIGIPPAVHLYRSMDCLELSVRTSLCLANDGVQFVGGFARMSEVELLRIPNLRASRSTN